MKKLIFALLIIVGCKATKDNRAVSRVLSDNDLSGKVYSVLVKQHPIMVDTVFKFINGTPVITYDTTYYPIVYTDTIINSVKVPVIKMSGVVVKYIKTIDTLVKVDPMCIRQLNDVNQTVVALKAQLQSTKDLDSQHKKQRNWYLAGGIVASLLCIVFIILLFKRR